MFSLGMEIFLSFILDAVTSLSFELGLGLS
jgi:hypothetical protein